MWRSYLYVRIRDRSHNTCRTHRDTLVWNGEDRHDIFMRRINPSCVDSSDFVTLDNSRRPPIDVNSISWRDETRRSTQQNLANVLPIYSRQWVQPRLLQPKRRMDSPHCQLQETLKTPWFGGHSSSHRECAPISSMPTISLYSFFCFFC